jgi:hypothetical protein
MRYNCINRFHKGFIVTRAPEFIDDELIVTFNDAPTGATAIFENEEGDSLYRLLSDNLCCIPTGFLVGEIKVTVAVLDGKESSPRYTCESFMTERKGNLLFVYPNWLDIPMQIVEMYSFVQDVANNLENTVKNEIKQVSGIVNRVKALEHTIKEFENEGVPLVFE